MAQDGEMNNGEEPGEKCQDMEKQRKESNWFKETGARFQFNQSIPHKSHGHPANRFTTFRIPVLIPVSLIHLGTGAGFSVDLL